MTKQEAKERITLVHCWTDINNNPTVNSYECSLYMNNDGLCENCEYHIALECIEKQIPKKPTRKRFTARGSYYPSLYEFYTCPQCGNPVEVEDNEGYLTEYYPTCQCGQRIDWNGTIEKHEMKWLEEFEEAGSDNE